MHQFHDRNLVLEHKQMFILEQVVLSSRVELSLSYILK